MFSHADDTGARKREAIRAEAIEGFAQCMIPVHLRGGLLAYILDHQSVGQFLTAYLRNDLREAAARADSESREAFFRLGTFLYNWAPAPCYGSPEAVERWLAAGQVEP